MKNQMNKTLEVLVESFDSYKFDEHRIEYLTRIAGVDMSMHNEFKNILRYSV